MWAVEQICVLWVSRGQSILLIGIFVVRNKGIGVKLYKYISRYIVSYAGRRNPSIQLCLANKRETQGFDLSVCSLNIS
jgi:hypothetical protein